jgi:hypothetical protein
MKKYVIDKNTKILKYIVAEEVTYNVHESEELILSEQEFSFNKAILTDGVFVENLSLQEIEAIENAKIPNQISIMDFRIQLIKIGIEIQDIINTINSIPTNILSETEKKNYIN